MNTSTTRAVISFIVPAYNEEAELPATLQAITSSAASVDCAHEIVVVDDASTDKTLVVAEGLGARVIQINRRQIAAARNAGARAASGDILIFVDADTHIAPCHVQGVIDALAQGFAGGGARLAIDREIPRGAQIFFRFFSALYFGLNLGAGAFLFTTRENFADIGGFDESYFAGEEIFFTWSLKKIGRFKVLSEPAITSGRKLRMHSTGKILGRIAAIIFGGRRAVMSRRKLDLWYNGQREDPPASTPPQART